MAANSFDIAYANNELEKTAVAPGDIQRLMASLRAAGRHPRAEAAKNFFSRKGRNVRESVKGYAEMGKSFNRANQNVADLAGTIDQKMREMDIKGLADQTQGALRVMRNVGLGGIAAIGGAGAYHQLSKARRENRQRKYWDEALKEFHEKSASSQGGSPLTGDGLYDNEIIRARTLMKLIRKVRKATDAKEPGGSGPELKSTIKQAAFKLKPEQIAKAKEFAIKHSKNIGMFAAPFVAAGVASALSSAASGVTEKLLKRSDRTWDKFVQRFPEFRGDEKAREYFNVLYDFNPSAARHPVVVRSYIEGLYKYDHFNPQILETMSKVEGNYRNTSDRDNLFRKTLGDNLKGVSDALRRSVELDERFRTETLNELLQDKYREGVQSGRRTLSPLEAKELLTRVVESDIRYHERLRKMIGDPPLNEKDIQEIIAANQKLMSGS